MSRGALILLYHRVTELDTDPQLLAVSRENFAAQLEILRQLARPVPLREIVQAAAEGRTDQLSNAVAVTFDDGYEDNLINAAPILHRSGVPATVFVASGGIAANTEFFWDELDRIFLQPNQLPPELNLRVGAEVYRAQLWGAANYQIDHWRAFCKWNVTTTDDPTPRQKIYRELCPLLHRATIEQREAALTDLRRWANLGEQRRATHRMMTRAQLRELVESGMIETGGHTINHPLLSVESASTQQDEIVNGKTAVEEAAGQRVAGFAYPFGGRKDYTIRSIADVQRAGFAFACSNFPGTVTPQADLFQLPRVIIRDWPAAEFGKRLLGWLGQDVAMTAARA